MTSARVAVELQRRERDRGRGVPAHRLGDHADARQLRADHRPVPALGDDGDVVGLQPELGVADDPVDRPLEQRALVEQRQERLGRLGSAERPQPRPAAAGHHDRVHGPSACITGNPIGAAHRARCRADAQPGEPQNEGGVMQNRTRATPGPGIRVAMRHPRGVRHGVAGLEPVVLRADPQVQRRPRARRRPPRRSRGCTPRRPCRRPAGSST